MCIFWLQVWLTDISYHLLYTCDVYTSLQYNSLCFSLKKLPKEKLRNGKIGFLNLFKPLDIKGCVYLQYRCMSFRHKTMLMQLSASLSQCSLSLILIPRLNFESFHLTFFLQKKVEKGDKECYLKSWLKILVQNLYSKSWRTEKNTKTRLQSTHHRMFWRFHDHQITLIFFPKPCKHYFKELLFPTPEISGKCFSKINQLQLVYGWRCSWGLHEVRASLHSHLTQEICK